MISRPPDEVKMGNRVNLDAMIPREDFAIEENPHTTDDHITEFPLTYLDANSSILKLLRKPDFQRETNHWTPFQISSFIESFLDNEVIPSLIFWDSASFIFVLDGGHRLSALRAWIEDDYGDKTVSSDFYKGQEMSEDQKRVAKRTRTLVEQKVGRYSDLCKLVDSPATDLPSKRAKTLFKRRLILQWVKGSPEVAESSFYKINSLGTPLDVTERMLIENRRKPIAIAARLILRAGSGHKYWSSFKSETAREKSVTLGKQLHDLLFEPESDEPLKTVDVPLGGSVSPIDALSLLIDFLTLAANREVVAKTIDKYDDDKTGDATVQVLGNSLEVLGRITGNSTGSLGLHTAVYFYNDKGKHSKFLFLGVVALIADKLRNNDSYFFKKFTKVRPQVEDFLIENKSLIGIILQNLGKNQRIPKIKDLFEFLVSEAMTGAPLEVEKVVARLGLTGRILDVRAIQTSPNVTDETKNTVMIKTAITVAPKCPLCHGRLEPNKSVSYDHILDKKNDGTGDVGNIQLAHLYCNNSKDTLL
jgi:Protein of unknown function DUF262/HNH endonuclease